MPTVTPQPATPSAHDRVVRFTRLAQPALRATDWDRLARGVPFRSWAWMANWWRHYGEPAAKRRASLFTLGVIDRAGALIGLAPWYLERSPAQGRVLRFLGTGEVCSDYLGILCEPHAEDRVATALADWLTQAATGRTGTGEPDHANRWDRLDLTGVDAEDAATARLVDALEARGNTVHRRTGPNCWRIDLPPSWDEYLAGLSKDHRKQVRRAENRMLASGRVVARRVDCLDDLPEAQRILVDLHQRRRRSLGEPGCFASASFAAFHGAVMPDLLRAGQLHLDWIELDGKPLAAEYHLAGGGVIYAYQSGIDPDRLEVGPGQLSHVVALRRAIEQGDRAFDFLRGDEPYKAHWRARPRRSLRIRVVPSRTAAQWRHGIWLAGVGAKHWIQSSLRWAEG